MTREKQIIEEAKLCASANTQIIGDWGEHYLGFIHGAKWADAHPVVKVGGALKNYERGYEDAIDKACDWLKNDFEELTRLHLNDIVINKFRKAMKGE